MSKQGTTIARHLRCPACQYDLFGLVEDSGLAHCPECGEDVDVDHALSELRARNVRASMLWLAFSVAAFIPLACAAVFCLIDPRLLHTGLLVFAALVWLAVLCIYYRRHIGVDYAGLVLLMFHGCFVTAAIGALLGASIVLRFVYHWPHRGLVVLCLSLAVPLFWLAWRLYWRACGLIEDGHDLLLRRRLEASVEGHCGGEQ